MRSHYFLILLCLFSCLCYGQTPSSSTDTKEEAPPKAGNFALSRISQQPGSFIAFGENIAEKGSVQLNIAGSYIKGRAQYQTETIPNLIVCPSDTSSILFATPYAIKFKDEDERSSGIEDMIVQFEHAFYSSSNKCYTNQATIVLNTSLPTGKASKHPATGFGASTYFIGGTFLRSYVDWLLFTSHGALITSSHHGTKFGNAFLYQFGLGKNIAYVDEKWIFNWFLEAIGQYTQKNKIAGKIDPDSGGNVILLIPSLWLSTDHIILQFGVGKPIVQHLFGVQNKNHYVLFGNFAWTF